MKKSLRILITNDDGINATGLSVLADVARKLAPQTDVWIVAPEVEQSGSSQSFTMSIPLRIRKLGERRHAVSGTPSDCIVVALEHLMKDCPPDLIFSGINTGLNTGSDVNLSGTLGGAFAGLMYEIPSVAISIKRDAPENMHWDMAGEILPPLLASLFKKGWKKYFCLSINLPNLPAKKIKGSRWTLPVNGQLPPFEIREDTDLRGKKCFWIYPHKPKKKEASKSDAAAVRNGYVSIGIIGLARETLLPASAAPWPFKPSSTK
ncbi:MAG: 5'/3'-nucleotidase SurE [Bdellovibrionales bacterium]